MRIGIAGLAGVLLMVGLAEFVIDNVRREAALNSPDSVSAGASATANATAQSSEPLADLGVTPSSDAGAPSSVPCAPPPAVASSPYELRYDQLGYLPSGAKWGVVLSEGKPHRIGKGEFQGIRGKGISHHQ